MTLADLARGYRRQRHFASLRVLLLATSPVTCLGALGLLGFRVWSKWGGNPYDLAETGALLLGVPVLWAVGIQVRAYFGK